jgi:hypothetical protein
MNDSIPSSIASRELRQEKYSAAPAVMAQLWSRTGMLNEVWRVIQQVSAWPGIVISPDGNGLCLTLFGVMLGHLDWSGRLDLPFEAEVSDELLEEKMVQRDPDHPESTRVIFDIRNLADADRAVWLLRLAYLSVDMGGLPPSPLLCRM